jgi:hypothetical protein
MIETWKLYAIARNSVMLVCIVLPFEELATQMKVPHETININSSMEYQN